MSKYKFLIGAVIALGVAMAGCSNTELAHYEAMGHDAHITCYSGGRQIFDGYSTGKLHNSSDSDGWEFMDRATGKLKQVSGDCVVEQGL